MRKIITLAIMALITLAGQAQLKVQTEKLVRKNDVLFIRENGHDYKVDTQTITVKLKEGKTLEAKGGNVIRENKLGYIDIAVPEGKRVEEYAKDLDNSGIFECVELNAFGELCSVTINDTYASNLWHLDVTKVNRAWELGMGNPAIKVAVLDNGINVNHPDIGMGNDSYKNIDETLGWDYITNSQYSNPIHGHGTWVAGIIGAKANNNYSVAGLVGGNHQQGTTLMSLRVITDTIVNSCVVDDAIVAATDSGARVINMSFGCTNCSAIRNAVKYAFEHDVVLVAASGNLGSSYITFPASHDSVFAVGATNINDRLLENSNHGNGLDLVAPGDGIYTTGLYNGLEIFSGTSSAAPQVTGAAALMLSINPNLTPNEVYTILRNTATKISYYTYNTDGWSDKVGYGLLNVEAAVKAAYPLEITGEDFICDSVIYDIANLPSYFFPVWDISNQYYKNSSYLFETNPIENNLCIIRKDNQIALNNDTLTAYIYDIYGPLIKTLKKCISTRTTARFFLDYEYSGAPVIMPILATENTVTCVPIGSIVKMGSPRFRNMTITPVGNLTLPYFEHNLDSVKFSPYGGFSLYCVNNSNCDNFVLPFDTFIPHDPIPIHFAASNEGGRLSITRIIDIDEMDMEENDKYKSMIETKNWQLEIYRYTDSKLVFSGTTEDDQIHINTTKWDSGIYIVRIVVDGQVFTQKIRI